MKLQPWPEETKAADCQASLHDHTGLLYDIAQSFKEEREIAKARHEESLTKLLEQHHAFEDRFSGKEDNVSPSKEYVSDMPSSTRTSSDLDDEVRTSKVKFAETNGEDFDLLPSAPSASSPAKGSVSCCEASRHTTVSGNSMDNNTSGRGSMRTSKLQLMRRSPSQHTHLELSRFHLLQYLQRCVVDERFEILIACLILAYSLILAVEVQYRGLDLGFQLRYINCNQPADVLWPKGDIAFKIISWFFGILFTIEAAFKIVCFGWKYLHDPWNHLDLACVLVFYADKIAAGFLPIDGKGPRLLRLCRLVRLVRLLRFLHSLDMLYIMTTAIAGMAKIVVWAIALVTLMLMTLALLLVQILHASYFNEVTATGLSASELERYHRLYEYFGSFTRCLLTMYELTFANWPTATRLLSEDASEWFALFCVIHKLTIGFAVVAVINGVILQETFKVAATDDLIMYRQKQRSMLSTRLKMVNLFETLDQSSDGSLSFDEFQVISEIPEVKTWLASMDIETDDLHTLFDLVDIDNSGHITLDELLERMPRIKGTARSLDVLALDKRMAGKKML
jgi:hypothetical protein